LPNPYALISKTLRYSTGDAVECVIADTCIGVAGRTCAEKFQREGVGVSLTVTSCWCYGSRPWTWIRPLIEAVWGFNGTERRVLFTLQQCLRVTHRKPSSLRHHGRRRGRWHRKFRKTFAKSFLRSAAPFSGGDHARQAISRWVAPPWASLWFRSGSRSGAFLGMRVRDHRYDGVCPPRRQGIYDEAEYEKALKWVKPTAQKPVVTTRGDQSVISLRLSTKWNKRQMALIARDLMVGNQLC
jgi:L-fucose isomerase